MVPGQSDAWNSPSESAGSHPPTCMNMFTNIKQNHHQNEILQLKTDPNHPSHPTGQATLWTKPELLEVPYTWKDVTCATPGSAGRWEDKGFPNDTAKASLITIKTKLEGCWATLLELRFLWKCNTAWQTLPTGGTCPWRRREAQRWRSHHHLESLPDVVQLHGSSMACRS